MSTFKLIPSDHYSDIAEAIRDKTGGTAILKSQDMPPEIENIAGWPPIPFTLEADNWSGTTYTLVTTSADYKASISTLSVGLSPTSTAHNADAVIAAGITLPYFTQRAVTVEVEGQNETQQEVTMYFSAIYPPTIDVVVGVYGLME